MIWIKHLITDELSAAIVAARSIKDERVQHFYDRDQLIGQALADRLGDHDNIVWDSYLFFAKSVKWIDQTPLPDFWAHQMYDVWPEHQHEGEALIEELKQILKRINV